jgi:8-oxo-dGTP pyrophosphatase MutT (NUDIX family)
MAGTVRRAQVTLAGMAREAIPTWFFALVVVRRGDEFLLVHERKHGQLWYLPAGRVEPRETIAQAALRETQEEAGIPIELEGVLRLEHSPQRDGSARCRVFFLARPADDTPPKSVPDEESLEAHWVALDAIDRYALRGSEVLEIFRHVARGGAVFPLDLLTHEGARWSSGGDEAPAVAR